MYKQIHDPVTGKIDALLFADFLKVKVDDMANLLGITSTELRENPISDNYIYTLNRVYILIDELQHHFEWTFFEVMRWMNTPNVYLKMNTPLATIFEQKDLKQVENLMARFKDEPNAIFLELLT